MTSRVEVVGLKELQAALKAVGPKMPRELTKAHKKVAAAVTVEGQQEMRGLPTPKSDEAAQGIRARATQRGAAVAMLGDNPFVRAAEFGTLIHHVFGNPVLATSMKRPVFRPWLGDGIEAGYALFPALRSFLASSRFEDTYFDALDEVYRVAFPEGRL